MPSSSSLLASLALLYTICFATPLTPLPILSLNHGSTNTTILAAAPRFPEPYLFRVYIGNGQVAETRFENYGSSTFSMYASNAVDQATSDCLLHPANAHTGLSELAYFHGRDAIQALLAISPGPALTWGLLARLADVLKAFIQAQGGGGILPGSSFGFSIHGAAGDLATGNLTGGGVGWTEYQNLSSARLDSTLCSSFRSIPVLGPGQSHWIEGIWTGFVVIRGIFASRPCLVDGLPVVENLAPQQLRLSYRIWPRIIC